MSIERAKSAREAVDVIVDLLLKYGQGGNCGYNKETYYDNAFLIMDKDEIYVMGDNRGHSFDSRDFGTVDIEDVTGEVLVRLYPFNKIGIV